MEHERAVLLEAEQAARAEAESAVRARDEFLTTASHELRTPLTSLSLATETLLRMVGNEPRRLAEAPADVVTRLLDTVRSQLRRFSTLVATLLDVSRVAEGRLKLHLAEADLATLARDVAAGLRPEAEDAGCTISVDAPAPVRGRWDSVRLEQVVTNLVSNAVHYGSGSPVEVAVRRQGEVAELTVRDRGAGIAPEDQERIWRRGERAVDASTHAGLGLGLFIARALVEAHGGTIGCESARGQGALFRVRLPIAGPPAS
jgi:signal transduction histidine kinase